MPFLKYCHLRRKVSLIWSGGVTCPSHTASEQKSGVQVPVTMSGCGSVVWDSKSQMWLLVLPQSLTLNRTLVSPDPMCLFNKMGINSTDFTCMVSTKWMTVWKDLCKCKCFATIMDYHCYFYNLSFLSHSFLCLKIKGRGDLLGGTVGKWRR